MGKNWHAMGIGEVARELGVDINRGLTLDEATRRLEAYGYNELPVKKKKPIWKIILEQFKDIFVMLLIFACIIAVFVEKSFVDSAVILSIVIFNVIVSVYQEYKAENILEKLREYAAPKAKVLREGKVLEIPAKEVVPGDIIVLEEGDKVPADARVIEARDLKVNEAPLTGESFPVSKIAETLPPDTPVPDRINMLYMGTSVVRGHGKGIVVGTGLNTEFGRIAKLVETVREEVTPLKMKLSSFAKKMALAVIIIAVFLVAVQILERGIENVVESIMVSLSLAVAAVPEGLPAILTITLVFAARKLARNNALVKYLLAAETLGSVTIICSDKTGTITTGEMTVKKIYVYDRMYEVTGSGYTLEGKILSNGEEIDARREPVLSKLLMVGTLCTNISHEEELVGDPTELAIVVAAAKGGYMKSGLESQYPRIREVPFSSERKRMSTVNIYGGAPYVFSKGAPEILLERCSAVETDRGTIELTEDVKQRILQVIDDMASEGYRLLAVAYRKLEVPENKVAELSEDEIESKLVFLGLVGIMDPPRPEVFDAIKATKKAGIKVMMITGDHALTAKSIAEQIGLYEPGDEVIVGKELDRMSDEELLEKIDRIKIIARAMPEQKLRIVRALKKKNHIVAMTGDGVNDAPALKEAHIGVAMGIKGTEVAKEAADLILLDDNFATIVRAIRLGREVYDRIKSFTKFLLSCNIAEVLIITLGILIFGEILLLPAMILWINLITDGPPATALAWDPSFEDVMSRPPRDPKEGVLSGAMLFVLVSTILLTAGTLFTYFYYTSVLGIADIERIRTIIFLQVALFELFIIWNVRSEQKSVFRIGFGGNIWLIIAIILSVATTICIVYTPLAPLFRLKPIPLSDWYAVLGVSLLGLLVLPELFSRGKRVAHP